MGLDLTKLAEILEKNTDNYVGTQTINNKIYHLITLSQLNKIVHDYCNADRQSGQVEKLVIPKITEDYLEQNMPEDYEIADEPIISNVYDNDKNIIENELYMIIPLRKKQ